MQNVCSRPIGGDFIDDVAFYQHRFHTNITINEST